MASVCLASAPSAVAQTVGQGPVRASVPEFEASPYVPLDDIAYSYIDALMARGELRKLSLLERPYTVSAIRAALVAGADTSSYSGSVGTHRGPDRELSNALLRSLAPYEVRQADARKDARGDDFTTGETDPTAFAARISAGVYATAQTSGRRELMLADGQRSIEPGAAIRIAFKGGPVVGMLRPIIDNRLNKDPEFAGKKDRVIAGRTEDAYLDAQWRYGEIFLGRIARNWGPQMLDGLQLGRYAYTYDQVAVRFGTDAVHLSSVFAKLDPYVTAPGTPGEQDFQRYFTIHRIAARRGSFEAAISEAAVFSGIGRSPDLSLINPLNIYLLSYRNERVEANFNLGAEFAWKSRSIGTYAAHVMVDDYQIDRGCRPLCQKPSSTGLTLTAEGIPLGVTGTSLDPRWFASYTRVSNLAYNNLAPSDRYMIDSISLGRGFSDYDEARLGLDVLVRSAPLRVYVAHRRQGQGDYRQPAPDPSTYATVPEFLSGTVMTVNRIGVSGGALLPFGFNVTGDLGANAISNADHVPGATGYRFAGRVQIAWIPDRMARH